MHKQNTDPLVVKNNGIKLWYVATNFFNFKLLTSCKTELLLVGLLHSTSP